MNRSSRGLKPFTPLLLLLSLLLAMPSWLAAEPVRAEDLEFAQKHLAKTRDAFVAATKGLTDEQWNFKPAPNRWSVAECAEHIAATEDALMTLIRDQVMKSPARTEPVDLKEIDTLIVTAIADRSAKRQAPEPLVPTKRFGSGKASVEHFAESRAKTISFLNETKDLRDHAMDSPLGQKLDALQWVLFISAHSERHTKQIAEVKADANFPK